MFDAFRHKGGNTYYGPRRTAATYDVTLCIVTYCVVVMAILVLMVVLGSRGKEKLTTLVRLVFNLQPGAVILVCLVSQSWQAGQVPILTEEYTALRESSLLGQIGLRIGLYSANITLAGNVNFSGSHGHVYYNERFSFRKVRDIREQYVRALSVGLPEPIIYVLEYLEVDAGGLRWHRVIREAGHFVFIMLGFALSLWVMANLLLAFIVVRGALFVASTGALMVGACALYHGLHPGRGLVVPFEHHRLDLHYGWSFWLCLACGIWTLLWGSAILLGHAFHPVTSSRVFLLDASHMDTPTSVSDPQWQGPLLINTPMHARKVRCQQRKKMTRMYRTHVLEDYDITKMATMTTMNSDVTGCARGVVDDVGEAMTSSTCPKCIMTSSPASSVCSQEFSLPTEGCRLDVDGTGSSGNSMTPSPKEMETALCDKGTTTDLASRSGILPRSRTLINLQDGAILYEDNIC